MAEIKKKIVACPNCLAVRVLGDEGRLMPPDDCEWCEGSGEIQINVVIKKRKKK